MILFTGFVYIQNQSRSIYGGDAGDLASAVITKGIPHPPGYPLYTLVGVFVTEVLRSGTFAWRLGFLSTVPALLSFIFLYDLLYYLTGKIIPPVIGILILAFTYPVWLYSETVEVFSLHNFFLVIILWSVVHWYKESRIKYFYLLIFFLGLSFTHQHIVIFVLPAVFYLIFKKGIRKLNRKNVLMGFLIFIIGLTPLLYTVIAAWHIPAVDWQGPPTFTNVIDLYNRSIYGPFRSNPLSPNDPMARLLNVYAFFDFFYKDFRLAGIIFVLLGLLFLWKYQKNILIFLSVGILCHFFFFFYASFALVDNFSVATFERFVQPVYIFFIIILAYGIIALERFFRYILRFRLEREKLQLFVALTYLVLFIFPLSIYHLNYPKISILKNDFTAENMARDILNTPSGNSILIISGDTPLFDTQYVYYSEKKWNSIKLIQFTKLFNANYRYPLHKYYPDMTLPDYNSKLAGPGIVQKFIDDNYNKFHIYSKFIFPVASGKWVPYGLLFRYYREKDLPENQDVTTQNTYLWNRYHNPLSGSLSVYDNLMLSDIRRMYALGREEIAYYTYNSGDLETAKLHLVNAQKLFPEDTDINLIYARVYIKNNECDSARKELEKVKLKEPGNEEVYELMETNYRSCYKDDAKASEVKKMIDNLKQKKETPLEKL